MTIYRSLPDDMKRKYESSNIIMLPDNSDVSNDTFENLQKKLMQKTQYFQQMMMSIIQMSN